MRNLSAYLVIVFGVLLADNVYSQITFGPQQIISTSVNGGASVYTADLDGDGVIDVLSASWVDNKIAWYKNHGSGNFGVQQIISLSADEAASVYAADLDGDGDLDVLSASIMDNKIAWYRNDGSGNFSTQQIITTAAVGAMSVHAADLDGDGDMDVLSASHSLGAKLAWYENDGSGNFGAQQIISSNIVNGAYSAYAADFDGDGDLDVLSAFTISWYENDGSGNFIAERIISTTNDIACSVYATDLDGDGDIDVLFSSTNDKIAWHENDGTGNFGEELIISTFASYTCSVYAADFDGDGDTDVLSASFIDDIIAWYENEGNGNFGEQQIISTIADGAISVYVADLDNDGDFDVLSASSDKIIWFENLLFTSILDITTTDTSNSLSLSPNPANNLLTLQFTTSKTQPTTLHLYDLAGKLLYSETLQATLGTNNYVLDMTKYPNGLYVVTLNNGVEVVSGKVVKE